MSAPRRGQWITSSRTGASANWIAGKPCTLLPLTIARRWFPPFGWDSLLSCRERKLPRQSLMRLANIDVFINIYCALIESLPLSLWFCSKQQALSRLCLCGCRTQKCVLREAFKSRSIRAPAKAFAVNLRTYLRSAIKHSSSRMNCVMGRESWSLKMIPLAFCLFSLNGFYFPPRLRLSGRGRRTRGAVKAFRGKTIFFVFCDWLHQSKREDRHSNV